MYHFNYEHDQWLILSLGGGLILVLLITLSFIAGWRPRPPAEQDKPLPASEATLDFIPWVLTVIYIIIFIYYFISPFLWLYWPEQW